MSAVLVLSVLCALLWGSLSVLGHDRPYCPRLQKPWKGQIIGTCSRFLGEECVFECRQPYVLVGSRVRVCQHDRTWSGQTTACELDGCVDCSGHNSDCPSLRNPENGYTEGQCNPGISGQTCTFLCSHGYSLHGHARLTCLTMGRWNAQPPQCSRTSAALCDSLNIPNGYATCSSQGEIIFCQVTCQDGYMLIGSSTVTCSPSGTWTDQIPSCQRSSVNDVCPSLFPPDGGRLVGRCTSANTGDTCQLVCLSGYRPTDTRILVCQGNGVWSNNLPRCIGSECPSIVVSRGTTSGTCNPGRAGQSCTVRCQSGSMTTLICGEDGRWSDNIPTCLSAMCPSLPYPVNGGQSGFCSGATAGQTCSFSCQAGYMLSGSSSAMCLDDGTWSSNTPICVRSSGGSCSNLFPPSNGYITGTCSPGQVGQTCVFRCDNNYVLVGDRVLTCLQGGRWSNNSPVCERDGEIEGESCSILTPPHNGEFVECDNRTGGRCVVACLRGYIRAGSRVRTCLAQGTWSGFAPTCTRRVGYSYTYKVVPLWSLVFG